MDNLSNFLFWSSYKGIKLSCLFLTSFNSLLTILILSFKFSFSFSTIFFFCNLVINKSYSLFMLSYFSEICLNSSFSSQACLYLFSITFKSIKSCFNLSFSLFKFLISPSFFDNLIFILFNNLPFCIMAFLFSLFSFFNKLFS